MRPEWLLAMTFYSIFTAAYGLLNLPVFLEAAWALGLGSRGRLGLALFFGLLVLGPAILGVSGSQTGPLAAAVYMWLGIVFHLAIGCLVVEAVKLIGGAAAARLVFFVVVAVAVGLNAFGFYEARQIKVTRLTLNNPGLPAGSGKLRVLQLSDLHLHSVETESRLERVLRVVEKVDYDLLVSTGDLIEAGLHDADWRSLAKRLEQVKPRLGKFAVFGNHEYYASRYGNPGFAAEFHEAAGFTVLRQESVVIGGRWQLAGVDDVHFLGGRQAADEAEGELLNGLDSSLPAILLKHRPVVGQDPPGDFLLQLSGHTHGGQIWPFGYLTRLVLPLYRGFHEIGPGFRLFVTNGAGTWGPPVRIGAPPEVVLITIEAGAD